MRCRNCGPACLCVGARYIFETTGPCIDATVETRSESLALASHASGGSVSYDNGASYGNGVGVDVWGHVAIVAVAAPYAGFERGRIRVFVCTRAGRQQVS